jgi:hypothetical protein
MFLLLFLQFTTISSKCDPYHIFVCSLSHRFSNNTPNPYVTLLLKSFFIEFIKIKGGSKNGKENDNSAFFRKR